MVQTNRQTDKQTRTNRLTQLLLSPCMFDNVKFCLLIFSLLSYSCCFSEVGDYVKEDENVGEVETDKVSTSVSSDGLKPYTVYSVYFIVVFYCFMYLTLI